MRRVANNLFRCWLLVLLGALLCAPTHAQLTDEQITAAVLPQIASFLNRKVQPDGVCLYKEENFAGERICFTESQSTLPSGWDNETSSIGVSFAYQAIIYDQVNFAGQSQNISADNATLGTMNNLLSSIRIEPDDFDADGVLFFNDHCPNTPSGESVDANGCSLSQLDADNDGVSDAIDICPGSPVNETADAVGCTPSQKDLDFDGVIDNVDLCLGTQFGLWVDSNGCSVLQADADGDGVVDYYDLCDNTPAGTTVTQYGCVGTTTDTDGDGITDDLDWCGTTWDGTQIDAYGCTLSQLDSDGDGINDDTDPYPFQIHGTQCTAP